ncbi:hypothetical protein JCGZ_01821 [Jatropha curcas]|uniref:MYB family protein n=1 Tax=Jatropha curcas TaxID=180498 RepID=A0A067JT89_JATCU|nr:transcription factor MYB101 [Jatropha curcas]AIT52225.1 MYB family protein [Jatropha curcas]KDP22719.1 hypothetical protein JCGZ_01821 [Jatropha curcas]
MISNDGGALSVESSQKTNQGGLKKGPWTASEDAILIEYVKRHGEGNWNSVQKNSGLMRCGKSCRLRWANHLRPNLKKGSFTPEEERIIIELHAKLGNKWARMASQLPGRTDNEIKNFWNTRMKRRQRAGLPIYPQEFLEEPSPFRIHQQQSHHQNQQGQQKHHNSSSSSPFSSLLSSSQKSTYNNSSLSLLDPINFSSSLDPLQNHLSSFYSNPAFQLKSFGDNSNPNSNNNNNTNSSLALPLSQYARSSPVTSIPSFNQNFSSQAIPTPPPLPPSLHYNSNDFENNVSFTSLIMGAHVEPIGLMPNSKSELPLDQSSPRGNTGGGRGVGGEASSKNNDNDITSETDLVAEMQQDNRNSGLLDALLMESENLSRKEKSKVENSLLLVASDKGKRVRNELTKEDKEEKEAIKRVKLSLADGPGEASGENHYCDDFSSSPSSIGVKPSDQEAMEELNSMSDDLLTLLDDFPSPAPLPEWYRSRNMSGGFSSGSTGDGGGLEVDQQETSPAGHQVGDQVATADDIPNVDWTFGSSYWNNMPGIC